jgi:hypothetical protein
MLTADVIVVAAKNNCAEEKRSDQANSRGVENVLKKGTFISPQYFTPKRSLEGRREDKRC